VGSLSPIETRGGGGGGGGGISTRSAPDGGSGPGPSLGSPSVGPGGGGPSTPWGHQLRKRSPVGSKEPAVNASNRC